MPNLEKPHPTAPARVAMSTAAPGFTHVEAVLGRLLPWPPGPVVPAVRRPLVVEKGRRAAAAAWRDPGTAEGAQTLARVETEAVRDRPSGEAVALAQMLTDMQEDLNGNPCTRIFART